MEFHTIVSKFASSDNDIDCKVSAKGLFCVTLGSQYSAVECVRINITRPGGIIEMSAGVLSTQP